VAFAKEDVAAYGVTLGGSLAIAGTVYVSRVFQIQDVGLAPFVYSTAVVAAVAFTASLLPAWRAALLSPLLAMRNTR
jgi:ABC-type lipoprotein release transport system permease subunit